MAPMGPPSAEFAFPILVACPTHTHTRTRQRDPKSTPADRQRPAEEINLEGADQDTLEVAHQRALPLKRAAPKSSHHEAFLTSRTWFSNSVAGTRPRGLKRLLVRSSGKGELQVERTVTFEAACALGSHPCKKLLPRTPILVRPRWPLLVGPRGADSGWLLDSLLESRAVPAPSGCFCAP